MGYFKDQSISTNQYFMGKDDSKHCRVCGEEISGNDNRKYDGQCIKCWAKNKPAPFELVEHGAMKGLYQIKSINVSEKTPYSARQWITLQDIAKLMNRGYNIRIDTWDDQTIKLIGRHELDE